MKKVSFFICCMYLNLCNVVEHHAGVDDVVDELNIDYTTKTNKDEGDHNTCSFDLSVIDVYLFFHVDDDLHLDMANTGKDDEHGCAFYSIIT